MDHDHEGYLGTIDVDANLAPKYLEALLPMSLASFQSRVYSFGRKLSDGKVGATCFGPFQLLFPARFPRAASLLGWWVQMDHPLLAASIPNVSGLGPPHPALAITDNSNRHLGGYFCGPDLISLRLL